MALTGKWRRKTVKSAITIKDNKVPDSAVQVGKTNVKSENRQLTLLSSQQ
jgi:hypothetical protein